jgi:hypothetical protein
MEAFEIAFLKNITPHSPKIVFRHQKAKVVATCSGGQSGLLNEIQRAQLFITECSG